jgi:hypothetical protein
MDSRIGLPVAGTRKLCMRPRQSSCNCSIEIQATYATEAVAGWAMCAVVAACYIDSLHGYADEKHAQARLQHFDILHLFPAPFQAIPEDIPLNIVYEDKDVIVVNKVRRGGRDPISADGGVGMQGNKQALLKMLSNNLFHEALVPCTYARLHSAHSHVVKQ